MLKLLSQHLSVQLQKTVVLQFPGMGLPQWPAVITVRMSSTSRHRKNSDLKGYDHLLHQWKSSQAHSGKSKAQKRRKQTATKYWYEGSHFDGSSRNGSTCRASKPVGRRQHRSAKGFERQNCAQTWSNADLAEAAAAAQLHPDEYHNLVFGRDKHHDSSTEARSDRRKARRLRRRAKRMQQTAKAWGYAEYSHGWSDSEDDSDEEWQQQQQQQQQHYGGAGRPDWQWWDEQQERQWFEQAWRQSSQQQGWQQQSQQTSSSGSSYGSYSSRPWWESFQQNYQQQQQYSQEQQSRKQHSRQHHQHQQSSRWQQAGTTVRHPPSVLEHLAVLGLPPNAALQRAQLKGAFHKAAMQWHPDMHVGDGPKAAAEAKFKQVKEAYESLVSHAAA